MHSAEHPIDVAARISGGRNAFAEMLGVRPSAIGNWKMRGVPIEWCVPIERLAAGAVTRRDLRPDDWHLIWPELAHPGTTPQSAAMAAVASEGGANAL